MWNGALSSPVCADGVEFCLLTHVDDIMYAGSRKFWHEVFLLAFQKAFTVSYSELGDVGGEISFLKRRIRRLPGGLALIPGTNIDALVQKVEAKLGHVRLQSMPGDASLQREDSTELFSGDASFYLMAVGVCLYLSRVVFPVKELASRMSKPTIGSLQSLKKLVGYLKSTQDYAVVLEQPVGGSGRWKQSNDKFWALESFSDSDWSGDNRHRRSTSAGMHLLCGAYMFGSSRTQRVISLSSCESEFHGMVSTLADGLFLRRCAEFVTRATIEHYLLTDSSSARQLAARQGVGKIKHISAKILWIQTLVQEKAIFLFQISTVWNVADAGTKVLSSKRLRLLLPELGVFLRFGDECVGQEEFQETSQRAGGKDVVQLARVVARVIATMGLGPAGAMGQPICLVDSSSSSSSSSEKWWFRVGMGIACAPENPLACAPENSLAYAPENLPLLPLLAPLILLPLLLLRPLLHLLSPLFLLPLLLSALFPHLLLHLLLFPHLFLLLLLLPLLLLRPLLHLLSPIFLLPLLLSALFPHLLLHLLLFPHFNNI